MLYVAEQMLLVLILVIEVRYMVEVTSWKPDNKNIAKYPSIKDGRIAFFYWNEKKTRSFYVWLSLDEAEEHAKELLDAVKVCRRVRW